MSGIPNDWERLKALILELREAGDDDSLDVEEYVELCLAKIDEAGDIIDRMLAPAGVP